MKGDTTGQGVVPLRTILRNILNLIDSFETRYKEGLDSYDQEFQELKQFSENLKSDPDYFCKEGEKSVNRKKNRYKDILPFDYTRVILADYGDIPGSDYINANFIKGASGSSAYIACQGPLPHTVNDFWRMVVECEVQVIVMACNEQESGKHKCENYWVEEEGVEREFGSVTIWLKKSRQVCPDFLVRTMKIRYPNSKGEMEERSVCQFHYSAWPDHGVPLKVRPLLDMVRLIRDCQTSETLPVLVHCSAGCGRTGTICAIDYVWGLLRLGKLSPDFSLFNLVRDMRRQRIAMVQTKDQYILVHRAVRELFEEQLKIIDSHPYANVDINGLPIDLRAELEEPVYETVQFVSPAPRLREDAAVEAHRKDLGVNSLPSPPDSTKSPSVHDKHSESQDKPLVEEKMLKSSVGSSSSSSLGSKNAVKVISTPSPSAGSHGEGATLSESKCVSDNEQEIKRGPSKPESLANKSSSSKSFLHRNPSIVKLRSLFEKSKEKDDKEKKIFPGLSRAKSDVSSSSRFYTNLANTFTSRVNRNPTVEVKSIEITAPPPKVREKTPVEKIKSKPALLSKPNISVKRSKSLKVMRPMDDSRENVNLISSVTVGSDVADGPSSKIKGASSSSSYNSEQHSSPEAHAIKVSVQHSDMPKLQQPVSKSVKPESFKATTSFEQRDKKLATDSKDCYKRSEESYQGKSQPVKKPDVPSKSHLLDKVFVPSSTDVYGTTRIKIGISQDDTSNDCRDKGYSKMNGKIKKYGTVNSKMITSAGGGTLLTRSQSHVWQPSKPQVPVRIFSDDNLSQVGTVENGTAAVPDELGKKSFDVTDGIRLHRKQSLPLTKAVSAKVKPLAVPNYESIDVRLNGQDEQQPRSLTLTSHTTFLDARKRLPKTNPYAYYNIPSGDNRNFNDLPGSGKLGQDKGSPLTQFHFGENVHVQKNGGNSSLIRNSSESSSNPGTPKNSLPGTPTQSTDVLYSPISVNISSGIITSGRNQSKSILKGSLSSTPSESDERLDLGRPSFTSSLAQNQVNTTITGPQKISSVRAGVGLRERRNSFRQAVWKEDQRTPKDDDKSENIYINSTSSVPYFVKSSAMPMSHHNPSSSSSMASSYMTPSTSMKTSISNNVSTTTGLDRPHRDYEPIWPDPSSSTNPFKIGLADKRTNYADPHNILHEKTHRGISSSNSSASLVDDKLPPKQPESQVQDRMAEIKVLLEELKAPGKVEGQMQRMTSSMDSRTSQIPTRTTNEKPSQVYLEKPRSSGDSRSSATSGLKYHRSLRAPSRPQYQQSFACFSFKKPSSFESITDQVYAEELMASKSSGNDESHSSNPRNVFRDDPFLPTEQRPVAPNQRLNDYVSLRNCKSASTSQSNGRHNPSNEPTMSQSHRPLNHHVALGKSDSTPIPPPRSKRGGSVRRDQGNYVNVIPDQMYSGIKYAWSNSKESSPANGLGDNHSYSNGTTSTMTIRKEASPTDEQSHHGFQMNGQDYSRISSTGSIPLTNSNNNNSNATSPKAIIRALGLFQAKAANVRSKFTNWSENKERPGNKSTN